MSFPGSARVELSLNGVINPIPTHAYIGAAFIQGSSVSQTRLSVNVKITSISYNGNTYIFKRWSFSGVVPDGLKEELAGYQVSDPAGDGPSGGAFVGTAIYEYDPPEEGSDDDGGGDAPSVEYVTVTWDTNSSAITASSRTSTFTKGHVLSESDFPTLYIPSWAKNDGNLQHLGWFQKIGNYPYTAIGITLASNITLYAGWRNKYYFMERLLCDIPVYNENSEIRSYRPYKCQLKKLFDENEKLKYKAGFEERYETIDTYGFSDGSFSFTDTYELVLDEIGDGVLKWDRVQESLLAFSGFDAFSSEALPYDVGSHSTHYSSKTNQKIDPAFAIICSDYNSLYATFENRRFVCPEISLENNQDKSLLGLGEFRFSIEDLFSGELYADGFDFSASEYSWDELRHMPPWVKITIQAKPYDAQNQGTDSSEYRYVRHKYTAGTVLYEDVETTQGDDWIDVISGCGLIGDMVVSSDNGEPVSIVVGGEGIMIQLVYGGGVSYSSMVRCVYDNQNIAVPEGYFLLQGDESVTCILSVASGVINVASRNLFQGFLVKAGETYSVVSDDDLINKSVSELANGSEEIVLYAIWNRTLKIRIYAYPVIDKTEDRYARCVKDDGTNKKVVVITPDGEHTLDEQDRVGEYYKMIIPLDAYSLRQISTGFEIYTHIRNWNGLRSSVTTDRTYIYVKSKNSRSVYSGALETSYSADTIWGIVTLNTNANIEDPLLNDLEINPAYSLSSSPSKLPMSCANGLVRYKAGLDGIVRYDVERMAR